MILPDEVTVPLAHCVYVLRESISPSISVSLATGSTLSCHSSDPIALSSIAIGRSFTELIVISTITTVEENSPSYTWNVKLSVQ